MTQTCEAKVLRHETSQKHQVGLRKLHGQQGGDDGGLDPASAAASSTSGTSECAGVLASTLPLRDSIAAFVQYGQPRMKFAEVEADPFEAVVFEVGASDIRVRSKTCKRVVTALASCPECLSAVKAKPLRVALAKQAYMIDLTMLTFHCYHSSPEDLLRFKDSLPDRDYQQHNLAGQDVDRFLRVKNNLELCRAVAAKLEFLPAWRVSPSLKAFWDLWLRKPHRSHSSSMEAEAYSSLVRGMTESLAGGRAREFDLVLASRVAAGALRSDLLVNSLCVSFLAKFHTGLQNCRRQTTSEFADYEILADSLTTLGKHQEVVSLLQAFKVNPKKLKALPPANDRHPQPFVAISKPEVLRENFACAQGYLRYAGRRPHIIVDETTWAADWSQVRQFLKGADGEMRDAWIGGCWSAAAEDDYSVLDAEDHSKDDLPKEGLAKLALHCAVQRGDSMRWLFDVCTVPRPPGVASALETLELVSRVLQQATRAGGMPPNGLAFDGGANNSKLLAVFLGQLDPALQDELPFFRDCKKDASLLELPFYPHQFLRYGSDILVCFNGSYHWQKRYSLAHLSGCRKIRHGGIYTDLSVELSNGLPEAAYIVSDAQSDVASCQRLSPPFCGKTWASLGVVVHGVLAALICSATTGSVGFSMEDICRNAMSALYLLLLHRSEASRQWTDRAERNRNSLSDITLKNGVALAHFAVVCTLTGGEPRFLQEAGIEHHFGRLKAPYRGHPNLKDYLYGHRSLCSRQIRQLQSLSDTAIQDRTSSFDRTPLTLDTVKKLSRQALSSALQFQACISENAVPGELYADLRKWWHGEGQELFRSPPTTAVNDLFDMFDITPDMQEQEIVDPEGTETSRQQAEAAAIIEAVHDRAKVLEDIREGEDAEAMEASGDGRENKESKAPEVPINPEMASDASDASAAASAKIPTNLQTLLVQALAEGGAIFDLSEPAAAGEQSMLDRLVVLSPFMRSFIKHARVQEGILSPATLNNQPARMSSWNEREHILAIARRAANVNQVRLSRAQAWRASQERLARDVRPRNEYATDADPGMTPPEAYFPPKDARFQVVAYLTEGVVRVGLITSAFRGAVAKKRGSDVTTVRTARPFPEDLPCSSTRLLHIAVCIYNKSTAEYRTSVAQRCTLQEPVNSVYGQMLVASSRVTATHLYFKLSQASAAALRLLCDGDGLPLEPVPDIPEVDETTAAAASAAADAEPEPEHKESPSLQFNDRSFMRASLANATKTFLLALEEIYRKKGYAFVDAAGMVHLENGKTPLSSSWQHLVQRVPGYFQVEFQNYGGHRFSRAVHAKLKELIPSGS